MIQISDSWLERIALDRPAVVELGEMEIERRMDRDEAGDLAALLEALDHLRQRRVGQPVAVVGEEHLLVLDEVLHRQQPLADVAPDAGIDQRDAPVRRPVAENLDLRAEVGNDAVAVRRLPVVQEVILDDVGLVAKAQDEVVDDRTGCSTA